MHSVLRILLWTYNLQEHYVAQDDQWMVIIAASAFELCSIVHTLKGYTPVQLVFGRDMVIPKKHIANWTIIH